MYPHKKDFYFHLIRKGLATATIDSQEYVLSDFFNYQKNYNELFSATLDVNDISENDIKHYLDMIARNRVYSDDTYNKYLSCLNNYFRFLFVEKLIDTYPTVRLKGKKKNGVSINTGSYWLYEMPNLLTNSNLHVYSRLTLFFLSKGYKISEILTPGFYQVLESLELLEYEKNFLKEYEEYMRPLRIVSKNPNLFLKNKFRESDQLLSYNHLFKYLKKDSQYLGWAISPRSLYQSYIVYSIRNNREVSDNELCLMLRLDPQSLDYYKKIAL